MRRLTRNKCLYIILIFSLIMGMVGCTHRLIPDDGLWFCEELDIMVNFNDVTKCEYMGKTGYEIGYERTGNDIYVFSLYPYHAVLEGCIIRKTDEMFILREADSAKIYKFIKQ